jgi:hypothetical protein
LRATRIIGGLSVHVLSAAIAWDLANDGFWSRHALFTSLGRWADVMVNSGTYAEIVDRHVELYSRLYWWGSVLDESDPLEEHLSRPTLSRVSPATQTVGRVETSGYATI